MQNFISKIESILDKANEDIEKLKFEAINSEKDENQAKKIEIISKYYQTILSSSMLFSKEIEEKVKCFYNYNSLNDNSVVYYNPKKGRIIESEDEVTPSFKVKTGKIIESDDEVDISRFASNAQEYDQIVINIPKNATIQKTGSIIICDDEAIPSFKIRGNMVESEDEITPSFKIKTGKVIESEDEITPSFAIQSDRIIVADDEVTPSFEINETDTLKKDHDFFTSDIINEDNIKDLLAENSD